MGKSPTLEFANGKTNEPEGTNVDDLRRKRQNNFHIIQELLDWIPHPTVWAGGPSEGIQ